MDNTFERSFNSIQTDMVSICLEYVHYEADMVFVYVSYEAMTLACDFFYMFGGRLYSKSNLPAKYDVNVEKQMKCLDGILDDMEQIKRICEEYGQRVPTEIKLTMDVRRDKLIANYRYDDVYSMTDKMSDDIVAEWYREIYQSLKNEADKR